MFVPPLCLSYLKVHNMRGLGQGERERNLDILRQTEKHFSASESVLSNPNLHTSAQTHSIE